MQFFKRLFARPFDPAKAADHAVGALKAALGPELASVVAFGSWAVGEYVEGHSDLNLLVVTRRLDAEIIKRLAPTAGELSGPKCRPLYFSQAELRRYAEAFPLKFQDMAETRKVLFGEDPFQRLDINAMRLAEDLENESRRLLIKFRHHWMRTRGAASAELAADTISVILPVLRGMLRLKKRKPPRQRVRVIEDACRQFRLSRRTLLQAHDLRYGRKNAGRIDSAGLLDRLLSELERLAELCVKFREEEPGGAQADRHERRERGERDRGERGERGDRDRGDRDRGERGDRDRGRRPAMGGDRNKRLADVRQMVADASLKKRWEPKEPDRFVTDEMARDTTLSLAARFAWDRAWQADRRAKGYVAVKPPEHEAPPPEHEDEAKPAIPMSTEEAAAALWADEVEEETAADAAAEGEGAAGAPAEAEPAAPETEPEHGAELDAEDEAARPE
jgi:predicted nucleotidyltransferase